MSTEEKKEEIPPEAPKEPQETNPYIVALQQRTRNINKRISKAEANQKINPKQLNINQKKALEELPSMRSCVKELEDFVPTFKSIEQAQEQLRGKEIEKNLTAIFTALLLPSYVQGENKHISPEQLKLLSALHDCLIPEHPEKPLQEAVAERVEFVEKILMESEQESPLTTPFNEIMKVLETVGTLALPVPSAAKPEPQPPRKQEKKPRKQQQPKEAPAPEPAPAAPAEEAHQAEAPAPIEQPQNPPKAEQPQTEAPVAPQEPKEPAKPEEKPAPAPTQPKRRTGSNRYVPENRKEQEAPKPKEEQKKEDRKRTRQQGPDPFRYTPKS